MLLIDTTACAPVNDADRSRFVLENALPLIMSANLAYVLHIRPHGNKLICVQGAPDVASLFKATGISYERKSSTAEALVRLDELVGHAPTTTTTSGVLH